jgi:hypothetical protein
VRQLGPFLSYLTRPRAVKVSIVFGVVTIVAAVINALVAVNAVKLFTGEILDAAELLRLSYNATLILIGYVILLFGFLRAVFLVMRNDNVTTTSKKVENQFIVLTAFIIAFFVARAFVVLMDAPLNPTVQLWLKGYRIHHFFYGIGLLVIGGWFGNAQCGGRATFLSAALYGIGLGLVVDEFGLLLTLGDYWSIQSYVFFVVISLFLLVLLLFEVYKNYSTTVAS